MSQSLSKQAFVYTIKLLSKRKNNATVSHTQNYSYTVFPAIICCPKKCMKVPIVSYTILELHCKDTIQKIRNKYSQK
jgi:hypothetical protein